MSRSAYAVTALTLVASLAMTSRNSWANIGEAYGFGSRTAALGGAGVAWGFDGYAAYSNPAGLPLAASQHLFDPQKRLSVSWGILGMDPQFLDINNVVVENPYVSDKTTYGDVGNDYRATLGQAIGMVYRLFPESLNFTFGFTAFVPLNQVAYMDTGESFVPEYFLYRARTQRPQFEFGFGAELGNGLSAGIGLHLAFSLTSKATVFLNTSANKPSTMRFSSSLQPRLAPFFGLLLAPADSPFTSGLVVRLPVTSANEMTLNSAARAFGSFAALDFNFKAISALYYDPATLELGGSWQKTSNSRTYLQFDYELWSKFQAPALSIADPSVTNCSGSCGVAIASGINPAFDYRSILVPRIGEEYTIGITTLRLGYAYRPSIVKEIPEGAGNYLDPTKHMLSAGAGFQFKHFLSFEVPTTLDFHFAYHYLVTQHVVKTPLLEDGTTSAQGSEKIGAPGYDAGGKLIGGGVSLSLVF